MSKHKFKTIEWENMEWVLLQDVLLFKKETQDEFGKWVAHTTQQDDLIEQLESQLQTKDAEIERLKELKQVIRWTLSLLCEYEDKLLEEDNM